MRPWWIVGIACGCIGAAAPARGGKCVDADVALQAQEKMEQRNEAAYAKALAKKKLQLVTLRSWTVARKSGGGSTRETEGTIKEDASGARTIQVLVGPAGGLVCGQPPSWEFAKNAKGELYAVDRVRKLTKDVHWKVCRCYYPPITCGGAAPEPVRTYYEIPEGLVFKGRITVEHAFQSGMIVNPDGCPPPDLPP